MRRSFLYNPKLKALARTMRNEMTRAEKKIWYEYLSLHEYRFLRQKPIGNYIVDFYCPRLKLVIEIDGETHLDNKDVGYDIRRTKELEKPGIKVLRFWNYDVLEGLNEVCGIIEDEITKIEKIIKIYKPSPDQERVACPLACAAKQAGVRQISGNDR